MLQVPVYKAEANIPDLADKVQSNRIIAYTSPVDIWQPSDEAKETFQQASEVVAFSKSNGSIQDMDLKYVKSLLVSTNWNKNDDVFGKSQVWPARATPRHKPDNLDHNELKIIGHMIHTWAVDNKMEVIPESATIDDLPSLFHIINGSVIYKSWADKDMLEKVTALIEAIDNNKKSVSMECWFTDFAYAIKQDNQIKVIARNEETAWLTKHLKAYGGDGEYDGCPLGRYLLNITFCGKGYVDNPANEYSSVINDTKFDLSHASIVQENPFQTKSSVSINMNSNSHNMGSNKMDEKVLREQIEQLQAQNQELQDKLAKADIAKYGSQIAELQKALDEAKAEVEASKQARQESESKLTEATANIDELNQKLDELEAAKAELQDKINQAEAEKRIANRISKLVSGGVSEDVAKDKVNVFANLNDEQFDAVASEIIAAVTKSTETEETEASTTKETEETEEEDAEGEETAAGTSVEDGEETDDVALTAQNGDELNELRQELASAVGHALGVQEDK